MNYKDRTITNIHKKKIVKVGTLLVSPSHAMLQMRIFLDALNKQEVRVPAGVRGGDWEWEWKTADVTERKQELRRLIGLWQDSDRDLNLLFKTQSVLQQA